MEHEVFVPVPVERLRAALADPAQVARAVPGLQQDAGSEPVAGRLKVRVGGHTITYRGTLRVTAREDGTHTVEGDASEVRGTGTVTFALTVRLGASEGGTTLGFEGTASAGGRIAQESGEAVDGAVVRLLNRFAENLGAGAGAGAADAGGAPPAPAESESEPEPERPLPADEPPAVLDTGVPRSGPDGADDDLRDGDDVGAVDGIDGIDGMDDLDDDGDLDDVDAIDDVDDVDDGDGVGGVGGLPSSAEPPAEAAHARRTMIGRSAEEVDHAPPRGRYAPVPAAQTVAPNSALRWAGPAAALVVASAIVVGRALRRRR
ncbi:SRPBCC domain-containing protein [Streptomyces sp. NPDC059894]|uniref:SRPBCC domain-containing protein n=1 Tax=unclassified Streptomyces TaxID=2593676 RepID=UPI0036651FA7